LKIYDVSLTITPSLPVWPGDPQVDLHRVSKMEDGAVCNISHLTLGVHTGTHVDAPYHFLPNGGRVDALPLEALIGPALVLEVPETCTAIGAAELHAAGLPGRVERVLFKSRNSNLWSSEKEFYREFVAILPDAAEMLVATGVRLVGMDYLSVAPFNNAVRTHEILLGAGVVLLEGLNLADVPAGLYTLYCLPLKLGGADGAPARTVLIGA